MWKLDFYLDSSLQLTGERRTDEVGAVEATVTLANSAPVGVASPRYIFGPGPGEAGLSAGTIRSLVTLYLPVGTSLEAVAGDATVEPASSGTEAGRPYSAFIVDIPAGEARRVSLTLRMPPRRDPYRLLLIPSPRIRPTTVEVDLVTEAGAMEGTVELDRQWVLEPGVRPSPAVAPIFR